MIVIRYIDPRGEEDGERLVVRLGAGGREADDGPRNGSDADARKKDYETV